MGILKNRDEIFRERRRSADVRSAFFSTIDEEDNYERGI